MTERLLVHSGLAGSSGRGHTPNSPGSRRLARQPARPGCRRAEHNTVSGYTPEGGDPRGALDAFYQEHRRCGELDGGIEGDRVSTTCSCGAAIKSNVSGEGQLT